MTALVTPASYSGLERSLHPRSEHERSVAQETLVGLGTTGGSRTPDLAVKSRQLWPLSYDGLVSPEGFEPSTPCLRGRSSTIELRRLVVLRGVEPLSLLRRLLLRQMRLPFHHRTMEERVGFEPTRLTPVRFRDGSVKPNSGISPWCS